MAGHSRWTQIKRQKGATDAKKGKVFSKMAKLIAVAARDGGPNPDDNLRLKYAIEKAKEANVPKDNIERAIRRGASGEGEEAIAPITYEGYGPGGAAVLIECLTDNTNRTSPEIRRILESHGGNLGTPGCVAWNFEQRGVFLVPRGKIAEEDLMEGAIEAGADDVAADGETLRVLCDPKAFAAVRDALAARGIPVESSEIAQIPKSGVPLDETTGRKIIDLMEVLQEHDDVQNVWSNFDIPETVLAATGSG